MAGKLEELERWRCWMGSEEPVAALVAALGSLESLESLESQLEEEHCGRSQYDGT